MSSFTSELHIHQDDKDPNLWVLDKSFKYDLYDKGRGWEIRVPKGFKTNFASSPRFMWWLIPPMGRYGKAAVIHDYLYATKRFSKRVADAIFSEAMGVLKVPYWKRLVMFKAVVYFGKKAWDNC